MKKLKHVIKLPIDAAQKFKLVEGQIQSTIQQYRGQKLISDSIRIGQSSGDEFTPPDILVGLNTLTFETQLEMKCTLTNAELINKAQIWVSKLCESGGKKWCLQVPVNFNEDPDMLFLELCVRLQAQENKIAELEGQLKLHQ